MQKRKSKNLYSIKNGLLAIDIIFILVLALITIIYFYIIRRSVNIPDEACYYCFPHRFILGEKPVADEWSFAQFYSLLTIIPFYLFYSIKQSTEGIIFFFRVFFVICHSVTVALMYFLLRQYGKRHYGQKKEHILFSVGLLIALTLFSCYIPWCTPTMSYYSISLMGIALLSILLFCCPASRIGFFFIGVVLVIIIIAEPASVLLYFAILLFALVIHYVNKKKKTNLALFLFEDNRFICFNCGVFTLAIPGLIYILSKCGIRNFFQNIHHLFESTILDSKISQEGLFSANLYDRAFELYGKHLLLALLIITILAAVLYKYRQKTRLYFTLLSFVILTASMIHAWNNAQIITQYKHLALSLFHGLPLYFSGPLFMLLAKKADRNLCLSWGTCACFSFLFGQSSSASVCWGGIAAGIFSSLLAVQVVIDALSDFKTNNNKTASICTAAFTSAAIVIVLLGELQWLKLQTKNYIIESTLIAQNNRGELTTELTTGPYKGILTTEEIASIYEKMIADLDLIKEQSEGNGAVFICNLDSWCYLYLDMNYSTYNTNFLHDDFFLVIQYWQEHPEKVPQFIYIPYYPFYSFQHLQPKLIQYYCKTINQFFEFEYQNGTAGVILRVTGSKLG